MNKHITLMLLLIGNFVFSQVGIATQTPHASSDLELGAADRALYLNRVADPENDVADPQPGMMLYDTTEHCVKVFGGDPAKWSDCLGGVIEPPTNPPGTGSLSGRMCFDVVEQFVSDECGTIVARTPQKADFSQTTTNTQTYTFTPSGIVNNVRFMYFNTNGQVIQSITPDADYSGTLTSSQTATATVVFYDNLNAAATGLSRENALLGDIYVIYNDGTEDKQLKLTAKVQDCNCCGAFVTPTLWKEFMCHNLGADESLDPFTPAAGIHGAKYKWGLSTAGFTQAQDQDPANAGGNSPSWTALPYGPNVNWNMVTQNPCPTGYRVPTYIEWQGVKDNNTYSTIGTTWTPDFYNFGNTGNFGPNASSKTLSLPIAGIRYGTGGAAVYRGENGVYWSSTISSGTTGWAINMIKSGVGLVHSALYAGLSVRCIAK